jgi:hypothetical protein
VTTRRQAVAEVSAGFVAQRYPRLIVSLILALAGLAAFAASAGTLRLGVEAMWLRYLVATVAGYAAFLLLLRVWIAFHREGWNLDLVPDFGGGVAPSGGELGGVAPSQAGFSGGLSGGGGATSNWGGGSSASKAFDAGVDVDDAWPVVLAAVLALGAVIAMVYVVYAAPALLAEVALDAALVTGIYRRVRKQDLRHWLYSAVRSTVIPAVIVAVCMALAGAALQWAAPTALSIGDVFRELAR